MNKAQFIRTLWGLSVDFTNPKLSRKVLEGVKKQGFSGVEIATAFVPKEHHASLKSTLKGLGLQTITQIHTAGYPVQEQDPKNHVDDFKRKVEESLFWDPVLINCHSGRDDWSLETSVQFFRTLAEFSKGLGVPISHETHRQRTLCNHKVASAIMDSVPEINYTLDLSHWVLTAERLLGPATDPHFENTLSVLERKTAYIHARVGSTNQIQVIDPQDPNCGELRDYFYRIWKRIVDKNPGLRLNLEYGPVPYAIAKPGSSQPVKKIDKVIAAEIKHLAEFLNN